MSTNISRHKRQVKLLNDENEVLQWIDGTKPLVPVSGTKNIIRVRHLNAIKRMIAEGFIFLDDDKKYKRVKNAGHQG